MINPRRRMTFADQCFFSLSIDKLVGWLPRYFTCGTGGELRFSLVWLVVSLVIWVVLCWLQLRVVFAVRRPESPSQSHRVSMTHPQNDVVKRTNAKHTLRRHTHAEIRPNDITWPFYGRRKIIAHNLEWSIWFDRTRARDSGIQFLSNITYLFRQQIMLSYKNVQFRPAGFQSVKLDKLIRPAKDLVVTENSRERIGRSKIWVKRTSLLTVFISC